MLDDLEAELTFDDGAAVCFTFDLPPVVAFMAVFLIGGDNFAGGEYVAAFPLFVGFFAGVGGGVGFDLRFDLRLSSEPGVGRRLEGSSLTAGSDGGGVPAV